MTRAALRAALAIVALLGAPAGARTDVEPMPTLVTAHDAWIALPAPSVRVAAGYLAIENRGAVARRLVAVSSSAFARVELHETYRVGDRVKMRRIAEAAVPARGALTLAPGGLHLMLFDPVRPLAVGAQLELALAFDDGTRLAVRAVVRDLRAATHDGH